MIKSIRARGLEFLGTNQIFNLFQFSVLEHPEQKPTQTSVERGNEWNKTHLEHKQLHTSERKNHHQLRLTKTQTTESVWSLLPGLFGGKGAGLLAGGEANGKITTTE